jgi:hypothetical protein
LLVTPFLAAILVPSSQLIDFPIWLSRKFRFGSQCDMHPRKTYRQNQRVLPAAFHHYLLFSTTGRALGDFDTRPFFASSISML